MSQEVECLPNKRNALISNPSSAKQTNKNRKKKTPNYLQTLSKLKYKEFP
jgi:hypothetical protein